LLGNAVGATPLQEATEWRHVWRFADSFMFLPSSSSRFFILLMFAIVCRILIQFFCDHQGSAHHARMSFKLLGGWGNDGIGYRKCGQNAT
jgi:hypothetical protein